MPLLKDTFTKLKAAVVGTKTSAIDTKLDKAVRDITAYRSHTGRNGYIELVRTLVAKQATGLNIDTRVGGLFSQGALSPSAFGQGDRILRYKTYDAIVSNINYCFRALNVLTDNVLSPDDITKVSLEIKAKSFLEDETPTEAKTEGVKNTLRKLELEKHLSMIVKNTLKFGDFFCELADSKTALISRSIYLSESADPSFLEEVKQGVKEVLEYKGKDDKNNETGETYRVIIDYSSIQETPTKKGRKKKEKLHLLFYEPRRIVKLQSELFPICFGYLVFPQTLISPYLSIKDQAVNSICLSILKSLSEKIPQMKSIRNKEDLKSVIASMLKQSQYSEVVNIRYVPPDRMQHFMIPSTKYYPYGESVFDASQFTAKVLIALETALAIHRLSRSTEKRKVLIEIGLPRDARKMIEQLKEEFRKRKISLDSFGTVDTIPSNITTFEDVYIPQKDGKPFVDISSFAEGNIDVRGKVDELKFLRDSVVASLGIPASFLNIEENLSNKAALAEENILFARTIVSHQKYFTDQIVDLVEKVYNVTNPEEALTLLDHVSIALAPPKSLQFERQAKYLGDLASLIETLERIGVPKEYSKKKYLTDIDWADVDRYKIEEKIDKELGTEKPEEEAGVGMGGMGAMPTF